MATPKQEENEKKFLDPVLKRLKPFWADVYDMMMRGKKRGDGVMLDDENLEVIEESISQKISEINSNARKEAMENMGFDSSRGWNNVRYSDSLSREEKDNLEDEKDRLMDIDLDDQSEKMAYATYMANEIRTEDRGSFVSANNLLSRIGDAIDSSKGTVVAGVFGTLRNNPSYTPKPPSQASTSGMSRMYGDTEEKARNRAEMRRSIFADLGGR